MKILVAEDNSSLRAFYETAFASLQVEFHCCSNGQECLDQLRAEPYDLVLLDLIMPVMDGFEVLSVIKKEFPKTKVVITSVQDDQRAIDEMFELGAVAYLTKPFTVQQLEKLIDTVQECA